MSTQTTPKLRDFGCANGWKDDPPEVKQCAELKHRKTVQNVRNCLNRYTCETCGITYLVDSSD